MDTTFRPIKGFPCYSIDENGRVLSFKRGKGRILKVTRDGDGYQQIRLWRDEVGYCRKIHILVAETFIGDKPEGMVVDHIDGNNQNNHYTNLRYVTQKDNVHNPNTFHKHISSRASRKVVSVKDGVEKSFASQSEAARELGIPQESISDVLRGKSRCNTTHGYAFHYEGIEDVH